MGIISNHKTNSIHVVVIWVLFHGLSISPLQMLWIPAKVGGVNRHTAYAISEYGLIDTYTWGTGDKQTHKLVQTSAWMRLLWQLPCQYNNISARIQWWYLLRMITPNFATQNIW